MTDNERLAELSASGVAVWLDDLTRDRIHGGNLQSLVDDYSVVGVTTNPSIFAAAISGSDSYDDQAHAMAVRRVSVEEALRTITSADVSDACDLLAPVAHRTGRDGRVSLEVAPGLAHDTDATAAEAAHLWWLVDRPTCTSRFRRRAKASPPSPRPLHGASASTSRSSSAPSGTRRSWTHT